jgi:hypothetical protein
MDLSTSAGAAACPETTWRARRRLVAVLVLALLAAATVVAGGAPSAAADPGSVDPSCGQTDPNAKVVAYTYVLDTTYWTSAPGIESPPRCPTNEEGGYWTAFLDAGNPRSAFAYPMNQTFVASTWTRLIYHATLDRDPEPDGLAYWTGVVASTGKVITVYDELLASQERFSQASSLNDYITDLYRFYTDADPDPAGLSYWTSYLSNGGKRQALTYALGARPDVTLALVNFAYEFTLGRAVDVGGAQYWSNVYRFVQGNELMVMALLTNSQEYFQNCQNGTLPSILFEAGSRGGAGALGGGLPAPAS